MRKAIAAAVLLIAVRAFADLDGSYVLPADHAAIDYAKEPVTDRIVALQQRISSGQVKLEFDGAHGYLRAVLHALDVPVSSQVLVFSKTSFQAPKIAPRTPRALYFNDDMSIGWVPGGDVVEIAAVDPRQGVIFYTLDQEKTAKPSIDRRGECLQCHASGGTLGVPGLVVRSVFPERSGMPLFHAGGFVTDHRSPLAERWGGWYVTGTHGTARHMGNVTADDKDHPDILDRERGANVTDLAGRFDTGAYMSPSSDIVALMVLEHQTRMTNLLTRVGWEARLATHDQRAINQALGEPIDRMGESATRRINNAVESMLKYMLFTDEAKLEAPVKGNTGFAGEFAARGPRDHAGRSLRDFDLERRLFRYPLSFWSTRRLSRAAAGGARPRVPPAVGDFERAGQQSRLRAPDSGRPRGGAGNPAGHEGRAPRLLVSEHGPLGLVLRLGWDSLRSKAYDSLQSPPGSGSMLSANSVSSSASSQGWKRQAMFREAFGEHRRFPTRHRRAGLDWHMHSAPPALAPSCRTCAASELPTNRAKKALMKTPQIPATLPLSSITSTWMPLT